MEDDKQNIENLSIKDDVNTAIFEGEITDDVDQGKITIDDISKDVKKLKAGLSESRKDYLQIFGVFASIITLVGFNANSAQKGIWEIIVGNFTLGLVFVVFIYLLYVVPKRVADDKSFIQFPSLEILFKKLYFKLVLLIIINNNYIFYFRDLGIF